MDADQGGGAKTQEADRVGNLFFAARLDQRLIEGDVGASAAQPRSDDAEWLVRAIRHAHALLVCLFYGCLQVCNVAPMPASICRRALRISLRFSLNG